MRALLALCTAVLLAGCLGEPSRRAGTGGGDEGTGQQGWRAEAEGTALPMTEDWPTADRHAQVDTEDSPLPVGGTMRVAFDGTASPGAWYLALNAVPAGSDRAWDEATNLSVDFLVDGTAFPCEPRTQGAGRAEFAPILASPGRCVGVLNFSAPKALHLEITARVAEGSPNGTVVYFLAGPTKVTPSTGTISAPPPCERDFVIAAKVAGEDRRVPNPWPTSPEDLRRRGFTNLAAALRNPTACYELYGEERQLWAQVRAEVRAQGLEPDRPLHHGTQYWIQYLNWPGGEP